MIACTGWTWDYIDQHVTLPQVQVLNRAWRFLPPAALTLQRIGSYLGLKPPAENDGKPTTPDDALQQAIAAGVPVFEGKPDDPILAFLDPPSA